MITHASQAALREKDRIMVYTAVIVVSRGLISIIELEYSPEHHQW